MKDPQDREGPAPRIVLSTLAFPDGRAPYPASLQDVQDVQDVPPPWRAAPASCRPPPARNGGLLPQQAGRPGLSHK